MSAPGTHYKSKESTKENLRKAWIKRKEKGLGIPWNTGIHKFFGDKEKQFKKGNIPWNTNTKGLIKANSGSFKKGEHRNKETEFKKGENANEKHRLWKGKEAFYQTLHSWVRRHKGKPKVCEHCGETEKLHWANISHEYKRDLDDFFALCRSCHSKYDGHNGYAEKYYAYRNGHFKERIA